MKTETAKDDCRHPRVVWQADTLDKDSIAAYCTSCKRDVNVPLDGYFQSREKEFDRPVFYNRDIRAWRRPGRIGLTYRFA